MATNTVPLSITPDTQSIPVTLAPALTIIPVSLAPVLQGEKGDKGDNGDLGAVTSVAGRTGDVTLAKADVGLGNVDNTNDAGKPVSTAQAAADSAVLNAAAADATSKANAAAAASDPAGTAATAVSNHTSATDPHSQYALESTIGAAGGIAPLDGTGKVAAAYLPSYVDDVIEAANFAALPGTGETGKIYVTLDDGKTWRWGGSAYAEISASPGSTDAVTEGSTNLYHTASRVLGQVLTGLSTAAGTVVTSAHTVLQAIGFLQKQVSDNTTAISGKAATGAIGSSGLTMATNKLLGRNTAATGAIEEITLGTNLSMTGTTLNAAGGAVSAADVELSPPTVSLGITNAQQGFELIETLMNGFEIAFGTAIGEKLDLAGGTLTGPLEMVEVGTAPAAPGANTVSIYAEDNGSGKTRLMARFATGAPVQIAIEP